MTYLEYSVERAWNDGLLHIRWQSHAMTLCGRHPFSIVEENGVPSCLRCIAYMDAIRRGSW